MRGVDDICLYREIIKEEIGWIGIIGKDSANFGSSKNDDIWLSLRHPSPYIKLFAQIDILAPQCQDFRIFPGEPPQDSRAHHAAMPGDPNSPLGPSSE